MIAIDSNVLLRLILEDDPPQLAAVERLFAEFGNKPDSIMLSDIVLVEVVWTLQSTFDQPKSAVVAALKALLSQPAFAFENRATLEAAVAQFQRRRAGFADCLIAEKNAVLGCLFTATFDRGMRQVSGVKVI